MSGDNAVFYSILFLIILLLVPTTLELFSQFLEGGWLIERELIELVVDAVHLFMRAWRGCALSPFLLSLAFFVGWIATITSTEGTSSKTARTSKRMIGTPIGMSITGCLLLPPSRYRRLHWHSPSPTHLLHDELALL